MKCSPFHLNTPRLPAPHLALLQRANPSFPSLLTPLLASHLVLLRPPLCHRVDLLLDAAPEVGLPQIIQAHCSAQAQHRMRSAARVLTGNNAGSHSFDRLSKPLFKVSCAQHPGRHVCNTQGAMCATPRASCVQQQGVMCATACALHVNVSRRVWHAQQPAAWKLRHLQVDFGNLPPGARAALSPSVRCTARNTFLACLC